nr:CMGC/CDK/CRK7 protein kinase [Kwoniella bestiolae CBS 10118]OCF23243.1 CMGC/CDK/CRK7 protein kinase [Kwoniella bestiolae CBS 10118]
MPSYEPLSANSNSTSTTSTTSTSYPRQPVKRESWRPGQPSSSSSAAQGGHVPTGPASSSTNRWADPSEVPSGSRSPVGKRDVSPSSSRGYEGGRSDLGERDNRGWNRDRDSNKRRNFVGSSGNNHNNGQAGGGERSWAAWNQKVQNTSNRQDQLDRDRGGRRDFDRDRDRDRNARRDERDRDRRRSGGRADDNNSTNEGGEGRSWAAWKAKVDTREREMNHRGNNLDLETVKKEGFWTKDSYNNQNHNRSNDQQQRNRGYRNDNPRGNRRDSPDYGNGSVSTGRGGRESPDYGTGSTKDPSENENDRRPIVPRGRGRESPVYGDAPSGRRPVEPRGGRGARDSPDYGVGGKNQERSRPTSPEPNDRKRAPSSPRASESKRPRDRSPSGSRRGSPSPPPVNRWGRHARQSPERRDRSPPSGPRGQSQSAPIGRRQPLAPQGDMFNSGGNRSAWGERNEPPQRRWGRDERMEVDGPPRAAESSNGYSRPNEGYHHDNYQAPFPPTQPQPPFPPYSASQPNSFHPPVQQSPYSAKPPPPPSDSLPYDSPPKPSSSTFPTFPQPASFPHTNDTAIAPQAQSQTIPVEPTSTPAGPIKIAFNASPRKGWKSISPSKTIQNLFEAPTSPSRNSAQVRSTSPGKSSMSPTKRPGNDPATIAPYIQAAFSSWYDQGMTPPIEGFLIHYFGREPSEFELNQVEVLLQHKQSVATARTEEREGRRQVSPDRGRGGYREDDGSGNQARYVPPNGRGRDWEDDRFSARHRAEDRERDHRYERDRRLSNGHNGAGGVNDIPVVQSRWTPSKTTHGPSNINNNNNAQTSSTQPTQIELDHHPLSSSFSQPQPQQAIQAQPQTEPSQQQTQPTPTEHTIPTSSSSSSAPSGETTSFIPTTSGDMYVLLSHVGEGTYGKVYKARNTDTGRMVALKKIRLEGEKDGFPVTAMREIKLLQGVRQGNVVRLLEIMVSQGNVHMVFEYMEHDLTGLLSHPTLKFSPANIKSLNYQMLNGLNYLHSKSILHRDMKGSNILLNSKGELKLADFGLARLFSKKHLDDYTNRVITLWYRSPELLMGETVYRCEVDMWSAGCIVLEIFTTKPIFQGSDEINQLEVIYNIMGTPKESQWPGVKELPWYELVKPKDIIESKFRSAFEKWLSPAALELVEGLLHFDPSRRLSAGDAMVTPYFESEQPPMEMPTQLAGMGEHHEMSAKQERQRRRQMEGR